MLTDPKERPTYSEIVQQLAALQKAAAGDRLTPSDGFSVYNGWQNVGSTKL